MSVSGFQRNKSRAGQRQAGIGIVVSWLGNKTDGKSCMSNNKEQFGILVGL